MGVVLFELVVVKTTVGELEVEEGELAPLLLLSSNDVKEGVTW